MRSIATLAASLLLSCAAYPTPAPQDFFLPVGDPTEGRRVFLEMGCSRCHRVEGDDLPSPVVDPAVPIVIGERSQSRPSDARLVTSIIHPNASISKPYLAETKTEAGVSRMVDFADVMTVQQLIDLVAFIRERLDSQ
jgi:hypothetical protein